MKSYTAKITNQQTVAKDTTEITFSLEKKVFNFEPGAYIRVTIPTLSHPDSSRDFSIVTSPNEKSSIKIAFRNSGSIFKQTLLNTPINSEVLIEGPFSILKLPKKIKRPIVLIAGGIGVTPFMSMLSYICEEKLPLDVTVLYANTDPKRALYLEELSHFTKLNNRIRFVKKFGDVTPEYIEENISNLNNPIVITSGTPAMVQAAQNILKSLQIPDSDIFVEEMTGYTGAVHLQSHVYSGKIGDIDSADVFTGVSDSLLVALDNTALVAITDANGDIVYANNKFIEVSKYSLEELLGNSLNILRSDYHDLTFYENLWDTVQKGDVWRNEIKNKAKDDTFYWTDSVIAPAFSDEGDVKSYIAIFFPINDRKLAEAVSEKNTEKLISSMRIAKERNEELINIRSATLNLLEDLDEEKKEVEKKVEQRTSELEQERNKLLQVTHNMNGGGILLDKDRNLTFVNNKAKELIGFSEKQKEGDILKLFLKKFENSDIKSYFKKCAIGETLIIPEVESEEKVFEIYFHCLGETDSNGLVVPGYFILFFDVTEAKLLERSKSELVAVASHQLRTPLTAMRGNVEMLVDESFGKLNEEQHGLLDDIQISTIRLITMVNEMLDITKIEKGDLEMTLELVSVSDVIESVLGDLSEYARRHEFTINHHKSADKTDIYGDMVRVRQVLQNLIDNSIKYSQHPGSLDISYVQNKNDSLEIILKDDGIGIPKSEQSKMFGRFYRASNTAKTTSSGSGLGLYIVKSIVEQMGGTIRFESIEGEGTTFFVTLPTKVTELKK